MNKPFFTSEKVNASITAIRSACGEIMYLIEGEDSALLIDTNLGVKGLRALVDSLTDKDYEVLITHGHVDHALGVPEFADKKVYMNHKDIPLYRSMLQVEHRDGYIRGNLGADFDEYNFTTADYVEEMPDFAFIDIADGKCFDLGGITVSIIAFPGHTPGCMAVLIEELRILITGDACNKSTFMFDDICSSVREYRKVTMDILARYGSSFDRIFICHHDMEVTPKLLSEMIEVCTDIIEKRADDIPFDFMGHQAFIAKKCDEGFVRVDGKCANLIYSKDNV